MMQRARAFAPADLELLEAWRATGSSRLDRDEDGAMDAGAAPVIMARRASGAAPPSEGFAVTGSGAFGLALSVEPRP